MTNENGYNEETGMIEVRPKLPRKKCQNHDLLTYLLGEKCPRCRRLSPFARYDYENA